MQRSHGITNLSKIGKQELYESAGGFEGIATKFNKYLRDVRGSGKPIRSCIDEVIEGYKEEVGHRFRRLGPGLNCNRGHVVRCSGRAVQL